MFKFAFLCAILAIAAAKPSGIELAQPTIISEPSHVEVREESLAKIGQVVESVPTSVSGYSTSVVHSDANLVTPIIAPALRTRLAPAIKTYETPVLTSERLIAEPFVKTVESLPILKTVEQPIIKTLAPAPILTESSPVFRTIESSPFIKTIQRPIARSFETAPLLRFAPEQYYTRSFAEPNFLRTYAEAAPALRLATFDAKPEYLRSDIRFAEPLKFGPKFAEYSPIVRSPIVGEANFLKTHAESAPGVSLSTFESKPTLLGERLTYGSPLTVEKVW